MNAYRWGVNLKLGLILSAMLIAVGSLWYTNRLANRLQQNETAIIELYASAIRHLYASQMTTLNPYQAELRDLEALLDDPRSRNALSQFPRGDEDRISGFRKAIGWARSMPPTDQTNFIFNEIIATRRFGIPAITTDNEMSEVAAYNNIDLPALGSAEDTTHYLLRRAAAMTKFEPFPVELEFDGRVVLSQQVHYDESDTIHQLRILPYVQLFFVGLFILVGYVGFSYVRRSEQNNLWVGMAKEAAHQLGTPISSMMGWAEVLGSMEDDSVRQVSDEMAKDIGRLERVASRFSKIGSRPELAPKSLRTAIEEVADYMRRRLPHQGRNVTLRVDVADHLVAPLNVELFEWVIENLIKNALDAMDGGDGTITIGAEEADGRFVVDVADTGKGIDKRDWKNVFRPGFSTKKRGWGLGLSLSRRIIEEYHGGLLALHFSKPGEGTTFRITLPGETGSRPKGSWLAGRLARNLSLRA